MNKPTFVYKRSAFERALRSLGWRQVLSTGWLTLVVGSAFYHWPGASIAVLLILGSIGLTTWAVYQIVDWLT